MNLNDYLVKISSIPRLTAEEERALHKRSRHDQIAKEQFIESNLWLVVKYAHKYASNGNLADLISEGSIGLMRAAERYDPGRGYRFGTYGAWHIKSFIIRYLKTDEITRLPHDMQTIEKRMKQAIGDHVKKKGYEPDNS